MSEDTFEQWLEKQIESGKRALQNQGVIKSLIPQIEAELDANIRALKEYRAFKAQQEPAFKVTPFFNVGDRVSVNFFGEIEEIEIGGILCDRAQVYFPEFEVTRGLCLEDLIRIEDESEPS